MEDNFPSSGRTIEYENISSLFTAGNQKLSLMMLREAVTSLRFWNHQKDYQKRTWKKLSRQSILSYFLELACHTTSGQLDLQSQTRIVNL